MNPTHYEILCVDTDADEPTIRAAHRRLVKIYHPDIAGAKGLVMAQKLNEAMDVLTVVRSRAAYDSEIGLTPASGPGPTAKPRKAQSDPKSKPDPRPAPDPIPAADVWRPKHVDVTGVLRPNAKAFRWAYLIGAVCWVLFWVITLLRPDTEDAGFFQWAYPIIAGGLVLLVFGAPLFSLRAIVSLTVIAAGPLWFLAHAPVNLYMPVTEILGGIGSRSLYAESVFALGAVLISVPLTNENKWDAVVEAAALWTAFEAEAAEAPRSMWLVITAQSHGDRTVVKALNKESGETVERMSLAGVCFAGQYILVDERFNIVRHSSAAAMVAHGRLAAMVKTS